MMIVLTTECVCVVGIGVFVITGTRKNHLRKTEYRISNLIHEDQWIKLRRNEQKTGIEFRPLRKVLSTI